MGIKRCSQGMLLDDGSGLELSVVSWRVRADFSSPGTFFESDHGHPMAMLERAVLEL